MFAVNMANILAAEEEERLEEMRNFNVERRLQRSERDPFSLSNIHFKQSFRLTKDMTQYVLNRILPIMNGTNNPVAVPVNIKFFAALSFFATGSYQRLIGQAFNISCSQQMVSKAVNEIIDAIVNELGAEFLTTPIEKNAIKARFMESSGFPGVIGAVDCTHVAILAPNEEEHNYLNRKHFHSKNIQLICDYDLKILNVNAQFPGATHDAFIWRNSSIKRELERLYNGGEQNSWLLGDSGYPLQPWLMTPVNNPQPNTPEANYNEAHIRARNCIERCNGVLKGRFRCVHKENTLRYKPERVGQIVNTCAILHNICVNGHLEPDFDVPLPEAVHGEAYNGGNNIGAREGLLARADLIAQYFRN